MSKMIPASETFAPKLKFALNPPTTTPTSYNSNRNQKVKQVNLSSHSQSSNSKTAGDSLTRLSNKPTFRPNNVRNRIKTNSKSHTTEKSIYETTTHPTTTQIQTTSLVEKVKNPSTNYTTQTEILYGQKNQSQWKLTQTNKRPETYRKNIWEIDEYLPNR